MNAIIISALWGVIMMFSGIFTTSKSAVRNIAIAGIVILLAANVLELGGNHFFPVDTHNMLYFETFGLLFNTIAFASTLLFFLLSAKDIENVGVNHAEYFALIFFVLCGISIATSFNTLLLLFIS